MRTWVTGGLRSVTGLGRTVRPTSSLGTRVRPDQGRRPDVTLTSAPRPEPLRGSSPPPRAGSRPGEILLSRGRGRSRQPGTPGMPGRGVRRAPSARAGRDVGHRLAVVLDELPGHGDRVDERVVGERPPRELAGAL